MSRLIKKLAHIFLVLPSFEVKLMLESRYFYTNSQELTVEIKATYVCPTLCSLQSLCSGERDANLSVLSDIFSVKMLMVLPMECLGLSTGVKNTAFPALFSE